MADFEQLRGNTEATAYRLGDVSAETQFALDHFNVNAPELLTDDLEDQDVILVDHNESNKVQIRFLVLQLNMLLITIESLTLKQQDLYIIVLNQWVVQLLFYIKCIKSVVLKLNVKLQDLWCLQSFQTAYYLNHQLVPKEDVAAAQALKDIAQIDLDSYGLDMLKAGASTTDKSLNF